MTDIFVAFVSIVVLTGSAWLFRRFLLPVLKIPVPVCPICIGVSATWFWMLIAHFSGWREVNLLVPGILMGGSVVGIAYQLEKRLRTRGLGLFLKAATIPIGFLAAYFAVSGRWIFFGIFALAAALVASGIFFTARAHTGSDKVKVGELEKKMEECC